MTEGERSARCGGAAEKGNAASDARVDVLARARLVTLWAFSTDQAARPASSTR